MITVADRLTTADGEGVHAGTKTGLTEKEGFEPSLDAKPDEQRAGTHRAADASGNRAAS